jgi:hypothetical protein
MPSKSRQKKAARPPPRRASAARRPAAKRAVSAAGEKRATPTPSKSALPKSAKASSEARVPTPELEVPLPGGRRHVLSLSFVRDGDEFLARLETDSGHITELKNRSLDQLLTLVASELEDLLE